MAKCSAIQKNLRRLSKISSYFGKRSDMRSKIYSDNISDVLLAMKLLDKTARWSRIRYRNRCGITGRPRGYKGEFGICRNALRKQAGFGNISGVFKCS